MDEISFAWDIDGEELHHNVQALWDSAGLGTATIAGQINGDVCRSKPTSPALDQPEDHEQRLQRGIDMLGDTSTISMTGSDLNGNISVAGNLQSLIIRGQQEHRQRLRSRLQR